MELKKGDVIRRKLKSGLPIGSFKVIDDVELYGVYAHDIPHNSLGSLYYTNYEISKVHHIVLRHDNKELKSIIKDRLDWTQHVLNKSWEDALKKYLTSNVKDKLIVVTLKSANSHIIVTEPSFRKVYYNGKCYIKLSFVRILEELIR